MSSENTPQPEQSVPLRTKPEESEPERIEPERSKPRQGEPVQGEQRQSKPRQGEPERSEPVTGESLQYDDGFGDGIGVGPHPVPWPEDERYDPELLAHGDRRNVVDPYRYWTREAIVADLDTRRHEFHVAVENWGHDFNIGSVVRTANAFLAREIHIVGRRRWNRRGAMVTDRYQHVRHHPDTESLTAWAAAEDLPIIGIDNLPGAVPLERTVLPKRCVLLFGQEGPGLTEEARAHASMVCSIAQFGSTRSINAGAAAAIAMHAWVQRYAQIEDAQIADVRIEDGRIEDGRIEDGRIEDGRIEDGRIEDARIEDARIEDLS